MVHDNSHLYVATSPSIRRRLAAVLYESILLFGIAFGAGLAFSLIAQQRSGLLYRSLLASWIAVVMGVYFVWCWLHGGQTLPMKTWHLRLVTASGQPLSASRALLRYLLSWLWFLPPFALHPLLGLSVRYTLAFTALWCVLWAAAARLDPGRQFPHDRLAGTRIMLQSRSNLG